MSTKVIMSCDENPYYLDFWPLVSRVWKERIGLDPVLVLVGEHDIDDTYGEVVKIKPLDRPVYTQAQLARLWYPIQEPETLWITSDIDMLPISRTYWKEQSQPGDFDWKNLNTNLRNYFPICYNVATGSNFLNVLGADEYFSTFMNRVSSEFVSTLTHTPENWNGPAMSGWNLDEVYVSAMACRVRNTGGKVEQPLRPGGFHDGRRINRTRWSYDPRRIESDFYIDCHLLRPYNRFRKKVDKLLSWVLP